jgi:pyruvate,water dikinase
MCPTGVDWLNDRDKMQGLITLSQTINVKFEELKERKAKQKIEALTHQYPDKENYFIKKLAEGVATIAAAFHPKEVLVRMSDFKTNEYANLIGGNEFEPKEENPMLGFRGALRYYNERYRDGFRLECEAIKMVRKRNGINELKSDDSFLQNH